jgi:hypothetical protein
MMNVEIVRNQRWPRRVSTIYALLTYNPTALLTDMFNGRLEQVFVYF